MENFLTKTQGVASRHDDTQILAEMVRSFQKDYNLYFLSGGGSNQHNQLLLDRPNIDQMVNADDAHIRKDIVLPTAMCTAELNNGPVAIYAGGGHSGLLTRNGRLFLWGWNKDLQCGTQTTTSVQNPDQPLPFIKDLRDIDVKKAALGFSHTLVIEKQTCKLYAFGNDERGQVSGRREVSLSDSAILPMTPEFLNDEKVYSVAAGLFHSAVITEGGELITWGCDRFGQSNLSNEEQSNSKFPAKQSYAYRRWKPNDDNRIVDVACGRRHTIAVDSLNRIWTWGENKHGQLGRTTKGKKDSIPSIVDMNGEIKDNDNVAVYCGWSHTIIHVMSEGGNRIFGFGRNDKGEKSDTVG